MPRAGGRTTTAAGANVSGPYTGLTTPRMPRAGLLALDAGAQPPN
jgi:hypothetical protein